MNVQAHLLLADALSLSRCGAQQQLRIGAPALGRLTPSDRGDVASQIIGPDFADQFAMVMHPEATGLQASNYYLHDISTFIERSTTAFKIHVGDDTHRHVRRVQLGQRRSQLLDGRCWAYL